MASSCFLYQCVELNPIESDADVLSSNPLPKPKFQKDQFSNANENDQSIETEIDQNLFMMTDASPPMERACLNPEENDPKCPSLSCDMYQNYQIKSVGQEQICFLQKYTPKASNCASLGICHRTQETFCEPSEAIPTPISIDTTQPCIQMEGCQGQTPGSRKYLVDQPCQEGKGICNLQGECKLSFACDENTFPNYASNGRNQFCPLGPNEMNVCEFYIHKEGFHPDGSGLNCRDFCAKYQTQCVSAWDNQSNTQCNKADPITCDIGGNDRICRCGPL
jgi:hypothetical protein